MKPNEVSSVNRDSFRCCLCCHVKTGTLIYGILVAICHLFAIGLLILAVIHPDVLLEQSSFDEGGVRVVQGKDGMLFEEFGDSQPARRINKDDLCVMFGITLVGMIATLALIYGVARNVASYVMPFFCLQVFYFCMSCITVLGCFTYAPNIKEYIHQQGLDKYPGMDGVMCLDSDYLMLLFVFTLIMILSVKAYLLGMVWSCYRYIQIHVADRSRLREYRVDPDTEMLLPPCYEDAIKVTGTRPPAYSSE